MYVCVCARACVYVCVCVCVCEGGGVTSTASYLNILIIPSLSGAAIYRQLRIE